MRLRRLIKVLTFTDDERDDFVLGGLVRVDPAAGRVTLVDGTTGADDVEQTARSRMMVLGSLQRWVGFEVRASNWLDRYTGSVLTTTTYRLTDGVSVFWWNGAAWATPGPGNWNTEDEIAENINTFPVTAARTMAVQVNLASSDERFSPSVDQIRLAWESTIEFGEDIITRTLLPALETHVLPLGRATYTMPADGVVVPLAGLRLEEGYKVASIDSVFDDTNDPTHLVNLYDSFDDVDIMLSASVDAAAIVHVNFIYSPVVAETTSQDYDEVSMTPALVIREVTESLPEPCALGKLSCARRSTGEAVVLPPPSYVTFTGALEVRASKTVDRRRIEDQILAFFRNHPVLRSTGLDEGYSLLLTDPFQSIGDVDQTEIHVSQCHFKIMNVLFWLKDAYDDLLPSSLVFGTGIASVNTVDRSQGVLTTAPTIT